MMTTFGQPPRVRVLQVAASDLTIAKLLLPLIDRLQEEGYEVEAASGDGDFARSLKEQGYAIHTLPLTRTIHPWRLARSLAALYWLLRREKFHIVHVHTPIAAAVGRLAARLAGTPVVIYTAHGFYFHEGTRPQLRKAMVGIERALGRNTHLLFTQSREDAQTAVKEKISTHNRVVWIGNGTDLERFHPWRSAGAAKASFRLKPDDNVVGFVGRLVREKGIVDLLHAMDAVAESVPSPVLLIAGDNRTAGDRDRKTQAEIEQLLARGARRYRVVFTGFLNDIERMMAAVDVFTLPSYREGMPRSIIEAMASGKPVVATNIRGCREEVAHGETGLLFPPGDVPALAAALVQVLSSPEQARAMGERGRRLAEMHFDEQHVLDRQVLAYRRLLAGESSMHSVRACP